MSTMEKIKTWLHSEHVEVTFRMGFTMFIGYVLTFIDTIAIPIETNILLGILVPFCSMLFPTLMFSFGTIILPLFSLFILVFVSSTLLLAVAVVGGSGAYLVAFALWCFWVTFFRFDKTEGNKTSLVLIAVVFQTVLIFPTFSTVQNGISIPDKSLLPNVEAALIGFIEDAVRAATELGAGTHMMEITTGKLVGRIAQITISSDGTSQTYIDGGMWLVSGGWTFSGTRNPLASYTNIMIFVLWLILILSVGVLMPPFRTMRSAVWRGIIPPAMKDAAKSIRLYAARMEMRLKTEKMTDIERDNANQVEETNELGDTSEGTRLATRGRCVYHINALYGGNLAKYTFFEPRLLAFKPSQCTAGILIQLSNAVSRCVRIAVGIELFEQMDNGADFIHKNTDQYLEVADTLEICAKAMLVGDPKMLDDLENKVNEEVEGQEMKVPDNTEPFILDNKIELKDENDDPASPSTGKGDYKAVASKDELSIEVKDTHTASDKNHASITYDPLHFKKCSNDVVNLSRKWLEAMEPSNKKNVDCFSSESLTALYNNIYPWMYAQVSHFLFLGQLLRDLFTKSTWQALLKPSRKNNLSRLIWCIKYTFGMTFLLAISIYWTAYKQDFVIASQDNPSRRIYAVQNGGWAIIAYCFATTQTAEGSVKKGILRMAGTIIGAFSGWLALLACEDGSIPHNHNKYGVIAWLSITSTVATYVSTERGFAARIGLSNDYAYGPIYFVLTQVIIVTYGYYYFGPEERGTVTMNRMFANLVGIVLAVILAVIPPGIWGGDPKHTRSLVRYHWSTTIEVLQKILSIPLIHKTGEPPGNFCEQTAKELIELGEKINARSTKIQELAVDFEKDAARLKKLPCFKIDPKLKVEIAKVTRDIHIAIFIPSLAANILRDPKKRFVLLERESQGRNDLEVILIGMKRGIRGKDVYNDSIAEEESGLVSAPIPSDDSTDEDIDIKLLLLTLRWIRDEMYKHEEDLDNIKWGI